jgi:hypothetical protein
MQIKIFDLSNTCILEGDLVSESKFFNPHAPSTHLCLMKIRYPGKVISDVIDSDKVTFASSGVTRF